MKKVAIITRTKNRNLTLRRTMQSVRGQTFKDFSWIVVNDGGGAKEVDQIINEALLFDIEVNVIHNKISLGMESASNIGIKNSRSKYIVILDDDDTWHPNFLEKTVSFLENPENRLYKGVVTRTTIIEEKIINNEVIFLKSYSFNSELKNISLFSLAKTNRFTNLSFLYYREALEKIGLYRDDFPVYGDWEFNLRFARHFNIYVIPENLSNYHIRIDNDSRNYNNSIEFREKWNHILRNELLRNDLDNRALDIGFLINIGHEIKELERSIKRGSIIWLLKKLMKRRQRFMN